MRQYEYYYEDDDAFGRCHGIQPIVLSTSRMPHSSLGAYISDSIQKYLNVSISDHKYSQISSFFNIVFVFVSVFDLQLLKVYLS